MTAWDTPHPWLTAPEPGVDPVVRANAYLRWVRQRSPQSDWITLPVAAEQHLAVLTALGLDIHTLNQQLHQILMDLLAGLRLEERPLVQMVAAPLALRVGIDGLCNLQTQPITLIVDPSRIAVDDWPHLVVHELAHALTQGTGHGPRFFHALTALCIAQDLPIPPSDSLQRGLLPYWPPCRPNPQADQFWSAGEWG
ncbi:hypothetical protein [Leptolyngbya sp. BL0902]|uniref:hypothetical protein n=1 Tax=Leptolyngbya sp. BL0902 TaxID=1115757 RepID=UPI0018E7D5ED|nr:hypothetical protein [Leptolyngbya sp. BL0902]